MIIMQEIVRVSVRNLSHQKLRTALTLLGVVIGIAAVVALISLSQGLSRSVEKQLEQLGPNNIFITPSASMSGSFGPTGTAAVLTERDLNEIKKINTVDAAIPVLFKSAPVEFNSKTTIVSIIGIPVDEADKYFKDVQSFEVAEGRYPRKGEGSVAVIGSRLHERYDKEIRIRDKIDIMGERVTVVGIIQPAGNQQYDFGIFMPIETLRDLTDSKDEITVILVKVTENPKRAAELIEKKLADLHNEKNLFAAITTDQLLERINSIFGMMSLVLIGIAGISLLVAGFGIMNTMLMSVIERTRDIGIMKAIGATNHRILMMFLIESGLVGLIGGIFGILLGYGLSFGLSSASLSFIGASLVVEFDPVLTIGVLLFAMFIGMISGIYPAYRAAKLDPVEALKYE